MDVKAFIKNSVREIHDACDELGCDPPEKIEFTIKLNQYGKICGQQDFCTSVVEVNV